MDISKMEIRMVKEFLFGLMVESMKAVFKMICLKEKEFLFGIFFLY